jgi:hypothetical protein
MERPRPSGSERGPKSRGPVKRKGRGKGTPPHVVAVRLASVLPEPNALIGALAVAAHGYVRATEDVDFVSTADPKEIRARLAEAGIESRTRRGDVLEGDIPSVVHGTLDGVRFDVIFPPVPIDWNRTVTLRLMKESLLRVVDLDTLVRLKLRAGGPQDLIDVVHLVRLHPGIEEKALAVSDSYGIRDRLVEWLSDPRIRSPKQGTRYRS